MYSIYNKDCLDGLKQLEDNSIDLVVTSPPYDNLRSYNNSSIWTFDKFKSIAQELYRVIKDGCVVVWVVGDATIDGGESGSSFKQALYFMECGFKLHDTMIYEKNSSAFPARRGSQRYTQIFEYMFVFVKGKIRKDISLLCDKPNKWVGHTNWGKNTMYDKDGNLIKQGNIKPVPSHSMRNNIWKYSTSFGNDTKHPAVFPYQLAYDHIQSWSNIGDTVLDPFLGSGTTVIASIKSKRNSIGFEIDQEYFNMAKERIERVNSEFLQDELKLV